MASPILDSRNVSLVHPQHLQRCLSPPQRHAFESLEADDRYTVVVLKTSDGFIGVAYMLDDTYRSSPRREVVDAWAHAASVALFTRDERSRSGES